MLKPKNADDYFANGCGRCPLGGTADCKVHFWEKELRVLRNAVLETGLVEELKWGVACYTHQKKNILILSAFKNYCSVSFFKGALLQDEHGILTKQGENSEAGRLIKFTNLKEVEKLLPLLKPYIYEAIEVEKSGAKVVSKKIEDYPQPDELKAIFKTNPALKKAFQALTPGRQRGYLLHFSQAKQSSTRTSRIEKCIPKIMKGLGFHD
ncbi:MAG: YdeI/OmpD-associated family protein [Chitinophagales bacterium]|nr:YdeI/OmpD-associated family protein [Chitinophagales bacterium]